MASKSVPTDLSNELVTPEFLAAQDFDALLSESDVDKLEEVARSFGVSRRIGYALLMRDKQFLVAKGATDVESASDTYLNMLEHFKDYKDHLENLLEQVNAAECRAMIVLASLGQQLEEV